MNPVDGLTDRQRDILRLVREGGFATIETLARRFDVSAQTIRRDIIRLDELDLLQRFHGGAGLRGASVRLGYEQKQVVAAPAKEVIAATAVGLLETDASLFLDVGTTTEAMARALRGRRDVTVVTPSLSVGAILAGQNLNELVVTGGVVRGPDGSLVGDDATASVDRFSLDWAVIACSGFDADGAPLDFDFLKVGVKRAMMRRARRTMLIADASKFERTALVRVAPLDEIALLVTDAALPEPLARRATESGCRVVIAEPGRPATLAAVG